MLREMAAQWLELAEQALSTRVGAD